MFETLENRQMFAATPLVITGTAGNDNIRVDIAAGVLKVVRNNVITSSHFVSDVSSLTVNLLAGNDSFTMSGQTLLAGRPINVLGGDGNDLIMGSAARETLQGGAGNDTINGIGGIDFVDGGLGNDTVALTDGTAHGGYGDDKVYGGAATRLANKLFGDAGNDTITAGNYGNTFMYGGPGNDSLLGGVGEDELYGEDGHDTLRGGRGHDRMFGGNGNDTIYAANDGSSDGISGGAGIDATEVDDRSVFFATWESQDSWSSVEIVNKF